MGRAAVAALLLVGVVPPASAEVAVRVAGERVDVRANAAPLADVLDDLAGKTGMEIVYEGSPPRQPVTLTLEGRTPAEAVLGILDGQGLNYALIADVTGTRVQTLMLAGPAGTGTISGSGAQAPRPRGRRPIMAPPAATRGVLDPGFDEEDPFADPALMDEEFPEEEPPFDDPDLIEDPALAPPGAELVPGATPPDPAAPAQSPTPVPFPGNRQMFPASPFTPQPTIPDPAPPPAGDEDPTP
jgi:hypothetical protein